MPPRSFLREPADARRYASRSICVSSFRPDRPPDHADTPRILPQETRKARLCAPPFRSRECLRPCKQGDAPDETSPLLF